MTLEDLLKRKKEILDLAKQHGAIDVRVFGSVSRNQATGGSDVDILVRLQEGRSLLDLGGLLMDLQDLLGTRVDVVTEAGLKKRIRDRVLKEAIAL